VVAAIVCDWAAQHGEPSASRFASTARGLAELGPRTLACMHGSSFRGDGSQALRDLANAYDERHSA
jgi:hypothetical protein